MFDPKYLYYAALALGFPLLFFIPVIPAGAGTKYKKEDYGTQIFLPTTIALLLIFIGLLGLNAANYDERKIAILAISSAVVASCISIASMMMSVVRIRWASD